MVFNEPNKRVIPREPSIPTPEFSRAEEEPALYAADFGGHGNVLAFHSVLCLGKHNLVLR